ncbi:hypothetical protein QA601_06245 [Chitinispirillales bacterium ANBcel5]|uniref:hypothetical protein n=1 Tax=Cellulosispirillum alkaliphilum TaxID=3039283 RepID=UPI002A518D2E|nr:hypothetical protein [Chitinispirillales bacterium ANBcel5]
MNYFKIMNNDNKTRYKFQTKTTVALTILLYTFISITSHLPAFHDHGFNEHETCSEEKHICNHSEYTEFEQIAAPECNDDKHKKDLCSPCMWQAMAKRNTALFQVANLISYHFQSTIRPKKTVVFSDISYLLPGSRAPPLF